MTAIVADGSLVDIVRWCQGITGGVHARPSEQHNPLADLSGHNVLRLLHCLSPVLVGHAVRKTGIVPNLQDLECAIRYVQECAGLLAEWPSAFQASLLLRAATVPATTSIRRVFGPIYRLLYRELADGAFDFLRHEFEVHLAEHWPGAIDGRHRKFSPMLRLSDAVSGKQIRGQLSCSRKTVTRLLADGTLTGTILHSPTGRTFIVSDGASVEHARDKLNNLMDLHAASRELGISRPRLRLLLDIGLIRSGTSRQKPEHRWAIPRSEIDRCLVLGHSMVGESTGRVTVSLAHIFKYKCRTDAAFIAIARALIGGTLRCMGHAPDARGISSFLVPLEDADRVIADALDSRTQGMTARSAAMALSVKEEVVYRLMQSGLLIYGDRHVNGRATRLVTNENLEDFRTHYVALVDVAQVWNLSSAGALKRLASFGVDPVTGPSVDGARQYFCRRSDVDAIALTSDRSKNFSLEKA